MSDPIEEVKAFFSEWHTMEGMRAAMQRRFTETTIWDNVGVAKTVGIDQALAFADGFNAQLKVVRGEVLLDHIAAAGNVVLTERTDNFYDAEGRQVMSVKLMGVLEMDGEKILGWRDYCDTKGLGL